MRSPSVRRLGKPLSRRTWSQNSSQSRVFPDAGHLSRLTCWPRPRRFAPGPSGPSGSPLRRSRGWRRAVTVRRRALGSRAGAGRTDAGEAAHGSARSRVPWRPHTGGVSTERPPRTTSQRLDQHQCNPGSASPTSSADLLVLAAAVTDLAAARARARKDRRPALPRQLSRESDNGSLSRASSYGRRPQQAGRRASLAASPVASPASSARPCSERQTGPHGSCRAGVNQAELVEFGS